MAEARASPTLRTPSSSASGSPNPSLSKGPTRQDSSLEHAARSVGKAAAKTSAEQTNDDALDSVPPRHRQLDSDAGIAIDSVERLSDAEGDDAGESLEATQELPHEPEQELGTQDSSENTESTGTRSEPDDTESSSDDPRDETFVPENSSGASSAETETESETSVARKEEPRHAQSLHGDGERRRKMWWTQEEVDFLRGGVRKHGTGVWKKILSQGQGIFLPHRTNMDLKDKWTNLIKRFGEEKVMSEAEINVAERARRGRSPRASLGDGAGEPTGRTKRLRRESSASAHVEAPSSVPPPEGVSNVPAEWVMLQIAADSFAEPITVKVNFASCVNVRTLKKKIRTKLLPSRWGSAAVPTRIELVSTGSRRLLDDNEQLSRCIPKDGSGLYVIPGSP